jgi:polysaccharide export outer membrane protein
MPGEYPLEPGMTVADLVRAGGSLAEAAFGGEAELARYQVIDGQARKTSVVSLDLAAALAGDPQADLQLQPFDVLTVRRVPQWTDQEFVTLEGRSALPGTLSHPPRRDPQTRSSPGPGA